MIGGIYASIWMFFPLSTSMVMLKVFSVEVGAMIKEHVEIWRDVKNNEEMSGLGSKVF
jgi:hypothetical protein